MTFTGIIEFGSWQIKLSVFMSFFIPLLFFLQNCVLNISLLNINSHLFIITSVWLSILLLISISFRFQRAALRCWQPSATVPYPLKVEPPWEKVFLVFHPPSIMQHRQCQFKLVLLGESAVGKSSLVLRFCKGQFQEYQESTIGGIALFCCFLLNPYYYLKGKRVFTFIQCT